MKQAWWSYQRTFSAYVVLGVCMCFLTVAVRAQGPALASAALATSSPLATSVSGTTTSAARAILSAATFEAFRIASTADNFRENQRPATSDSSTTQSLLNDVETTISEERLRRSGLRRDQLRGYIPTLQVYAGSVSAQPTGALTGRIVFASAGHGWTYDTTTSLWATQRPLIGGIVEDYGNIDQLNIFADILFRAGATIVSNRPLGRQSVERIVDNADAENVRFYGAWRDSESTIAFRLIPRTTAYRYAVAATTETAVARFQPFIPKADFYPVYCWARDGADRVNQTYRVVHAGGCTIVRVNHRMVGKGWVYLGEYYFERGRNGYVEVTNQIADPLHADGNHVVIADAIRFGNGLGDVNRGGGISGFPREEEASRYWAETMLADGFSVLYDPDRSLSDTSANVGTPPRVAAHMNRESEGSLYDRIYLGFHSNAGRVRGAIGLFCNEPSFRTPHQVDYARNIAEQINEDFETTGRISLPHPYARAKRPTDSHITFGEIRADYLNNEMASTILEAAFHDNAEDLILLRDYNARVGYATSSLRTILRLFAQHDPRKPTFVNMPETPQLLSALATTTTSLSVEWQPSRVVENYADRPDAYRVEISRDGNAFERGPVTTATVALLSNQDLSRPLFVRVVALNRGGESRPSQVLGASNLDNSQKRILLLTHAPAMTEDLNLTATVAANLGRPGNEGGAITRIVPRLMNAGNQAATVGLDVASLGYQFDARTAESLTTGSNANFENYSAIITIGSRQPAAQGAFGTSGTLVLDMLRTFGMRGRTVIYTGSEIAEALAGTSATVFARGYAKNALKISAVANDEAFVGLEPASGDFTTSDSLTLKDNFDHLTLRVAPVALVPSAGADTVLRFVNRDRLPAVTVTTASRFAGPTATVSLPVELLQPESARRQFWGALLRRTSVELTTNTAVAKPQGPSVTVRPRGNRESRRGRS